MRGRQAIDFILFLIFAAIALLAFFYLPDERRWIVTICASVFAVAALWVTIREWPERVRDPVGPVGRSAADHRITELALLNEDGNRIAVWQLYGKISMVIGRDVGENSVDVNLSSAAYASMIEIEHAVLNYSGKDWYIEDISAQNGVSVQKATDGKKYKLARGNPCKLEPGDVVYIAMTKLLLR